VRPSQPACYVSFEDAQAFCSWSKTRLPNEAEFMSASVTKPRICESIGESELSEIRSMLGDKLMPFIGGHVLTADIDPQGLVIARSGPKYLLARGWEKDLAAHRHLKGKNAGDIMTRFHVCRMVLPLPVKNWQGKR